MSKPSPEIIDVHSEFTRKPGLGAGVPVTLLVKYSQTRDMLVEHRREFREARKRGRFAPLLLPLRETKWGGGFIAALKLDALGQAERYDWMREGDEVRGYASEGDTAVVALANALVVVETATGKTVRTIERTEFRNLHSVEFTGPGRVLVSNTGFDGIIEVDLDDGEITWEWQAWDHGFDVNPFGFRLRRKGRPADGVDRTLSLEDAYARMRDDEPVPKGETWGVEVDFDRVDHPLGLDKWLKSVEPNWAGAGAEPGEIFTTFFVANQLARVDRDTGAATILVDELSRPHAAPTFKDWRVVTDTRKGQALFVKDGVERIYDFSTMPHPVDIALDTGEWLQFTAPIADGALLASVDSRRAALFVWDPERGEYCDYACDPAWAVQSVLAYP